MMIRPWSHERWRLAVVLLAAGAVALAAVLHLGLGDPRPSAQTNRSATTTASTPAEAHADATPPPAAEAPQGPTRPRVSDPVEFARSAASTLFDWDTTTDTPSAITTSLLAIADPTGEEPPGLLADLPAYLPDDAWWHRLRDFGTRQRLEISTAEVPDAWDQAVASGQVPNARPGTTAVTLTGVRHRTGVVAGQPQTAAVPVAFTMFVACPPADECRLLRLGAPGKVLE